jgi:hypothetical protein
MIMNETYIRVFSAAVSTALQEMMRRGGSREEIAEEVVDMAILLADRAIENDALCMQDGTAMRLHLAAQMMAALVPQMLHHTKWDLARRAVELADALIEQVERD